jgi:hypothetical protein
MLIFQLADRLGLTVRNLMENMTIDEFMGWLAFHKINSRSK